jgi:hypothetical protein
MVILQVVYSKYVTQKKLCENTNLCIFTNLILYASSHTKNRILFSCVKTFSNVTAFLHSLKSIFIEYQHLIGPLVIPLIKCQTIIS